MGIGYKKSRTGCTACKKRRVKCDERQPCSACVRHKVTCSLTERPPRQPPQHPKRTSYPRPNEHGEVPTPRGRPLRPAAPPPPQKAPGAGTEDHEPPDEYTYNKETWASDLELMHHYTMSTSQTLGGSSKARGYFKVDVPRLAHHHHYLLHQILAISAFHMAYLYPASRHEYWSRGSRHQALGLTGVREALSRTLTDSGYRALFMASSILILNMFASGLKSSGGNTHSPGDDPAAPLDALLDIFSLLRGTIAIDMFAAEKLRRAPSDDFYDTPTVDLDDPSLLPLMRTHLQNLRFRIHIAMNDDSHLKRTLNHGIASLLECTEPDPGPSLFPSPQQRILNLWPMVVGDDFMALIRGRSPPALVVFWFYCVVLRFAERDSWFLGGWTDALAGALETLLKGSPWADEASWPMERIRGEVSPETTGRTGAV